MFKPELGYHEPTSFRLPGGGAVIDDGSRDDAGAIALDRARGELPYAAAVFQHHAELGPTALVADTPAPAGIGDGVGAGGR